MYKWKRATMSNGRSEVEVGLMKITKAPHRITLALLFTTLVVVIVLLIPRAKLTALRSPIQSSVVYDGFNSLETELYVYNATYPLTQPQDLGLGVVRFKIGIVADQDESSKENDETWSSVLKLGTLTYRPQLYSVTVTWDKEIKLESHLAEKGRGAELSELIVFNGKLLTVDDRTGVVYEIIGNQLVARVRLNDGPGNVSKGFKSEWMARKGHRLYVGGLGKEWTTVNGVFVSDHPQWVKEVSPLGHVTDIPWAQHYNGMKSAAGILPTGYIIHESACWSDVHQKWFFLPRRASSESYNDVDDEHRATNIMITADENFSSITVTKITTLNQFRGFSSFKFIPSTEDQVILALKSEEIKGTIATYILAFDLNGRMYMEETKIGDLKFEGVEFL